jgi:aspartate beta-hydroxylase
MESDESREKSLMDKIHAVLDEYHLNPLQKVATMKFIKEKVANQSCDSVSRLREWLLRKINKSPIPPPHPRQLGCPDLIPSLRASPWWDVSEFSWVPEVEAYYNDIREELVALYRKGGFQPYRGPSWATGIIAPDIGKQSHDSGDWNVFYLYLHGLEFDDNISKCPKTVEMINKVIPRHHEHAFFSAVNPNTHIITHHGPSNKKLRLHFPIIGVDGTRLRVADDVQEFEQGKVKIFDDSFDHEAWHDGNTTRVNLIIDFWHPDLTDDEVKFFKTLQNSKIRVEKRLTADMQDTFYSVIERAKDLRPDDNSWWTLSEENKNILNTLANAEIQENLEIQGKPLETQVEDSKTQENYNNIETNGTNALEKIIN